MAPIVDGSQAAAWSGIWQFQELAAETGVDWFVSEAPFPIEDERRAWELTAASVRKLGALGAYRAPNLSKSVLSFVALTRIQKLDPPLEPPGGGPFAMPASRRAAGSR